MFFNDEHNDELKEGYDKTKYWKDLNINHDLIVEIPEQKKKEEIKLIMSRLTVKQLSEICNILNLNGSHNKKDLYIDEIVKQQESIEILLLDHFSKRKKRSIDEFYESNLINLGSINISSVIGRLLFAYKNDRCNLFQILTLEEWNVRGTGYELKAKNKTINWEFLGELVSNEDAREEFKTHLYESSDKNQQYKLKSYCTMNKDNKIFMIYKLKTDTQKSDFDESKRLKDVEKIIIKINIKNNSVHIKGANTIDLSYIYLYLKEKTKSQFDKYEDPIYEDYNEKDFKKVFSTLEKIYLPKLKEFKIDKIEFSESLLDMSPELSLNLPKRNIWSAVNNVVSRKIVSIESLSSVKSMNINYKNISRKIHSIILDDGSVIFKLQDHGLNPTVKKEIGECFKLFFGVPLNSRINDKLERGKADSIDLILRLKEKGNLDDYKLKIFEELVNNNIIYYKETFKNLCKNKNCRADMGKSEICKSCGGKGYEVEKKSEFKILKDNILENISNSLIKGLNLTEEQISKSTYKVDNIELCRLIFNYKSKNYQIIVTDSVISKKTMDKIEKMLVPTIIVYFGVDKYQVKDTTPSTIEKLQFGTLYINKDDEERLNKIYKSLIESVDKLYQHHIVSASTNANNNIKEIVLDETKINKEEYTYNDLEDDTYTIVKHIFYNSDKWGRENIGEAVPEGVFAMSYIENSGESIERRYAFSYDCKLTAEDKGYDLGRGEKRKAEDYVVQLNSTPAIKAYCSNNIISAHIFIGNKFKKSQIEDMSEFFYQKMPRGCLTKPMFIEIDNLLKLHDWYRLNYQDIKINMNQFYEELYKVMINRSNIIDEDKLNKFFKTMSVYFNRVKLDIDSIKEDLMD